MPTNYDRIAPVYDALSRLVYGNRLRRAQQQLLTAVPAGSRVLLVGGGTGQVLEDLAAMHPTGLQLCYVEQSDAMLRRAKRRSCGGNAVEFIHASIEDCVPDGPFDVVFTAFLFDNFRQARAETIFRKLNGWLAPGGRWLFADFQLDAARSPAWQKALLAVMYGFFRACCGIEARHLPDMRRLYGQHGYRQASRRTFYSGFIEAIVYER